MEDGKLVETSKINVTPEDYGIVTPALMRDKIGKEFEVTVKANYVPFLRSIGPIKPITQVKGVCKGYLMEIKFSPDVVVN